jgi:hypothetical protein
MPARKALPRPRVSVAYILIEFVLTAGAVTGVLALSHGSRGRGHTRKLRSALFSRPGTSRARPEEGQSERKWSLTSPLITCGCPFARRITVTSDVDERELSTNLEQRESEAELNAICSIINEP